MFVITMMSGCYDVIVRSSPYKRAFMFRFVWNNGKVCSWRLKRAEGRIGEVVHVQIEEIWRKNCCEASLNVLQSSGGITT